MFSRENSQSKMPSIRQVTRYLFYFYQTGPSRCSLVQQQSDQPSDSSSSSLCQAFRLCWSSALIISMTSLPHQMMRLLFRQSMNSSSSNSIFFCRHSYFILQRFSRLILVNTDTQTVNLHWTCFYPRFTLTSSVRKQQAMAGMVIAMSLSLGRPRTNRRCYALCSKWQSAPKECRGSRVLADQIMWSSLINYYKIAALEQVFQSYIRSHNHAETCWIYEQMVKNYLLMCSRTIAGKVLRRQFQMTIQKR